MTWTMETDEEAKARARTGAIGQGRYQIYHPVNGHIEMADTRLEAFKIAERYETRTMQDGSLFCGTPYEVMIYDRMARNGCGQLWRRQPKDSTYCMEKFDFFTMDSRWKCIERRGMIRRSEDLTTRLWS